MSFISSLTVLPALARWVRPACLKRRAAPLVLAAVLIGIAGAAARAQDEPPLTGDEIARRVNARDEGAQLTRVMLIELIADADNPDRKAKKRTRLTRVYRKRNGNQKRTAIFYLEPTNVKGTAFLNIEYLADDRDDDRWLYLPALRKVRRIAASSRGHYFLGTDLTYEDISNETKVNIRDYVRTNAGRGEADGHACVLKEAKPRSEKIAGELGYSRVVSWVDPMMWMLRKAEYWDERGRKIKTVCFREIRKVQGIWTAHRLEAQQHQTGHRTNLIFSDVDYEAAVDDDLFTVRALRRGP